MDRARRRRSRSASCSPFVIDRWFARPRPRGWPAASCAAASPSRPTRACASSAGSSGWTIIVIGVSIALSQFTGLSRIAGSVLASGALAAAVIGFAARQTLANLVAGIMLALAQPLRVGDWVTFEEHSASSRTSPELHGPAHARRAADRDPERAAGGRDPAQRHARGRRRRPGHRSSGCRADADVRARARRRCARRPGRPSASPSDARGRAARRSAASACRRPSAPRARPSCASACLERLRAAGVLAG